MNKVPKRAEKEQPNSTDLSEMRWPIVGADGEFFDLMVDETVPDRHMDPCPDWCVIAGHDTVINDEDRVHWGLEYGVPVQSIPNEFQRGAPSPMWALGHIRACLHRPSTRRHPVIWVGVGESHRGVFFTLDEAVAITKVLDALVESATTEPVSS